MQSRAVWRIGIAASLAGLAVGLFGWSVRLRDARRLAPLRAGMRFEELQRLYGWPLWTVGRNEDLQVLASRLRFRSTPLVGHCLNAGAVGGRALATPAELPWILSPRTARQVWLFRTGLVTGILVYPDDAYGADCIFLARPSSWFTLFD
jgi:hypothetical protein